MANMLYEYRNFEAANMVVEESKDGKSLLMSGIFVQADVRNQNQRVYPMREIVSAVNSINERIKNGNSVLGELDHPSELTINLDRVSHIITDMWMEGANGFGKLKVLPTPTGKIVEALLSSGVKLGVSSRGSGNVSHDGSVSDFEIVTVDIVAQPSAPDAYPRAIYESLFNMRGGEQVYRLAQDAVYDSKATSSLQNAIHKFFKELTRR